MARESCNLDKDEAEILKPSSSSASPPPAPPSPPAVASSPPGLFLKPPQDHPIQRPESPVASSGFTQFKDRRIRSGNEVSVGNSLKSSSAHKRKVEEIEQPMVRSVNRCFSCRKKVGLTGFKCRCGSLFCARHRYSDAHECSFDYKASGREEIAKANPVIRAAKIIKI